MRITQDLRQDAIAQGLADKAAEFRAGGQEVYRLAQGEGTAECAEDAEPVAAGREP